MISQNIILIIFGLLILLLLFYVCNFNKNECMNNSVERYEGYEGYDEYNHLQNKIEHFNDVGFEHGLPSFEPDYAWLSQHNLLPWWNSTRRTRNMSYDLRGDVPIVPYYVGPWNNSPLI